MTPATPCREIVWKLGPFVDGELPAEERQQVEDHLASCKECVQMAVDFRQVDQAAQLEKVPPVRAEEWTGLYQRVLEAANRGARDGTDDDGVLELPRARARTWLVPLLAAAAGILIGIGVGSGFFPGLFVAPVHETASPPAREPTSDTDIMQAVSGPRPTIIIEDDVPIIDYSRKE